MQMKEVLLLSLMVLQSSLTFFNRSSGSCGEVFLKALCYSKCITVLNVIIHNLIIISQT